MDHNSKWWWQKSTSPRNMNLVTITIFLWCSINSYLTSLEWTSVMAVWLFGNGPKLNSLLPLSPPCLKTCIKTWKTSFSLAPVKSYGQFLYFPIHFGFKQFVQVAQCGIPRIWCVKPRRVMNPLKTLAVLTMCRSIEVIFKADKPTLGYTMLNHCLLLFFFFSLVLNWNSLAAC